MTINVIVTSEPIMKRNQNGIPYVTFNIVEKSTENNPNAYIVTIYNKASLKLVYLYLHKGDNVSLEGKLKSSQNFIVNNIGADFLQKVYS